VLELERQVQAQRDNETSISHEAKDTSNGSTMATDSLLLPSTG
jgi:hypothetical protein